MSDEGVGKEVRIPQSQAIRRQPIQAFGRTLPDAPGHVGLRYLLSTANAAALPRPRGMMHEEPGVKVEEKTRR
jgi:hypothetical protein